MHGGSGGGAVSSSQVSERIITIDMKQITHPASGRVFLACALTNKTIIITILWIRRFSETIGKSYTLTEGTLGLATRAYSLKRYNDGTFELDGRADASLVHLQYSESAKIYFTSIAVPLPEELNIADDRYVFTGGTESMGIYFVSLQSISGNTMTIYLSAMNYVSEIPLVEIGFRLTGHWE